MLNFDHVNSFPKLMENSCPPPNPGAFVPKLKITTITITVIIPGSWVGVFPPKSDTRIWNRIWFGLNQTTQGLWFFFSINEITELFFVLQTKTFTLPRPFSANPSLQFLIKYRAVFLAKNRVNRHKKHYQKKKINPNSVCHTIHYYQNSPWVRAEAALGGWNVLLISGQAVY